MLLSTLILHGLFILALLLPKMDMGLISILLGIHGAFVAFLVHLFKEKEMIKTSIAEHNQRHIITEKTFEHLLKKHEQYDTAITTIKEDIQEVKGDNKVVLANLEYIKKAIDKI